MRVPTSSSAVWHRVPGPPVSHPSIDRQASISKGGIASNCAHKPSSNSLPEPDEAWIFRRLFPAECVHQKRDRKQNTGPAECDVRVLIGTIAGAEKTIRGHRSRVQIAQTVRHQKPARRSSPRACGRETPGQLFPGSLASQRCHITRRFSVSLG